MEINMAQDSCAIFIFRIVLFRCSTPCSEADLTRFDKLSERHPYAQRDVGKVESRLFDDIEVWLVIE